VLQAQSPSLANADGFVEIAENEQFIDVDQEVTVCAVPRVRRKSLVFAFQQKIPCKDQCQDEVAKHA